MVDESRLHMNTQLEQEMGRTMQAGDPLHIEEEIQEVTGV